MQVYIFGNRDWAPDAVVFGVVDKIKAISEKGKVKSKKNELVGLEFVEVKPNEDLPFAGQDEVVIMDVVMGLNKVTVLTEKDLDRLELPPRSSAHEFDLGFQLRYLKKLGKIRGVKILGLPMRGEVDVDRVIGILIQEGK